MSRLIFSEFLGIELSMLKETQKPLMQYSGQLIQMGAETQIVLKPQLTYTTEGAIEKFNPIDRGCVKDGETKLSYLTYDCGYEIDMDNCINSEDIREIISGKGRL